MKNEELKKRYTIFCKAFNLNVGDVIKIYGWNTYFVGENCFYVYEKGLVKKPRYQPFDQFMSRGFEKLYQE